MNSRFLFLFGLSVITVIIGGILFYETCTVIPGQWQPCSSSTENTILNDPTVAAGAKFPVIVEVVVPKIPYLMIQPLNRNAMSLLKNILHVLILGKTLLKS